MNCGQIIDSPIFSMESGEVVGALYKLIIDNAGKKISYCLIKKFDDLYILPFTNIINIGDHSVIIDSDESLTTVDSYDPYNEIVKEELQVIGKNIVNSSGGIIGKIIDYSIDKKSGKIIDLICHETEHSKIVVMNLNSIVSIDNDKASFNPADWNNAVKSSNHYFDADKEGNGIDTYGDSGYSLDNNIDVYIYESDSFDKGDSLSDNSELDISDLTDDADMKKVREKIRQEITEELKKEREAENKRYEEIISEKEKEILDLKSNSTQAIVVQQEEIVKQFEKKIYDMKQEQEEKFNIAMAEKEDELDRIKQIAFKIQEDRAQLFAIEQENKQKLAKISKTVEYQKAELEKYSSKVRDYEENIHSLSIEHKQKADELSDNYERKISSLLRDNEQTVNELTIEIDSLKDNNTALLAELQKLNELIAAKEKEISDLKKELRDRAINETNRPLPKSKTDGLQLQDLSFEIANLNLSRKTQDKKVESKEPRVNPANNLSANKTTENKESKGNPANNLSANKTTESKELKENPTNNLPSNETVEIKGLKEGPTNNVPVASSVNSGRTKNSDRLSALHKMQQERNNVLSGITKNKSEPEKVPLESVPAAKSEASADTKSKQQGSAKLPESTDEPNIVSMDDSMKELEDMVSGVKNSKPASDQESSKKSSNKGSAKNALPTEDDISAKQKASLLGKRLTKNITDRNGNILVSSGKIIDEEIFDRVKAKNKDSIIEMVLYSE